MRDELLSLPLSSHGKRGGARVIYYWAIRKNVILLLYISPSTANSKAAMGFCRISSNTALRGWKELQVELTA
jgi:hypothetical protein